MLAWLKRFGLHLAAAVGATGIFVAAAAVGAHQTRQSALVPLTAVGTRAPGPDRKPTVVATPTPLAGDTPHPGPDSTQTPATGTGAAPRRTPASGRVAPERSLAGTVQGVLPDEVDVLGVGGRLWRVAPTPGALIRLNGRAATLDAFEVGDKVVILGQAEPDQGRGNHFLAHAITARRT